jgi:hypothetical protein
MKKKVFLGMLAATSLFLGSCSNDMDHPGVAGGNAGKIEFNTRSSKPLRAETTTATIEDFAVGAWDVVNQANIMNGITVNKTIGPGAWDYSGNVFWPLFGEVYFYGISPASAVGTSVTAGALTLTDTVKTITYTTPTVANMKDLLVAKQVGTYAANGQSGVTLNFRHALARIQVDVITEGDRGALITEFALVNLNTVGTLKLDTLPKNTAALPYPTTETLSTELAGKWQKKWNTSTPGAIVYDRSGAADTIRVAKESTANLIGGAGNPEIYVIPQTTAATPAAGVSGGETPGAGDTPPVSGFYLRLKYTQDGKNWIYYIPVQALLGPYGGTSITFEMERRYAFTIHIVSGIGIDFTANMSAYDNVNIGDIDVPVTPVEP